MFSTMITKILSVMVIRHTVTSVALAHFLTWGFNL